MLVVVAAWIVWLALRGELSIYAAFATSTANAGTSATGTRNGAPTQAPGVPSGDMTPPNMGGAQWIAPGWTGGYTSPNSNWTERLFGTPWLSTPQSP